MKKFLVSLFFLLIFRSSHAGTAGGPYVIWINLSENAQIEQTIASRIESYSNCQRPRLVITPLPDWISKKLVKDAIIGKNKSSLRSLRALLRKPYSGLISNGFDGLIAYDETASPRFSAVSLVWSKSN